MGFLKKIIEKFTNGFFYVVDIDTLRLYLYEQEEFSNTYSLPMVEEMHIFLNGEKHRLLVWNYSFSDEEEDKRDNGIAYIYDKEEEYSSMADFIDSKLQNVPEHFKIELIHGEALSLNEYMELHPELKVEEY